MPSRQEKLQENGKAEYFIQSLVAWVYAPGALGTRYKVYLKLFPRK